MSIDQSVFKQLSQLLNVDLQVDPLINLSSISQLSGQTIVIKYGGNAMTETYLKNKFAENIALIQALGLYPIVVHGGGPQINQALNRLAIPDFFIQGQRVTDAATMQVVEWALCGEVQQDIVRLINLACIKQASQLAKGAVGISGADGQLLLAEPLILSNQSLTNSSQKNTIHANELGQVGKVVKVNTDILKTVQNAGFIPVVTPVASNIVGKAMNINADSVAGAIAIALKANKLITMTNTLGVLDSSKNLITHLNREKIEALKLDGTLNGGMLPKIDAALKTSQAGVESVHIIDGRAENAVLHALFTQSSIGTVIIEK